MSYDTQTKADRMAATRDRLNNGFVDGLNVAGTVLISWPLDAVSGTVAGPVLTLAGFPKTAVAAAASTTLAPVTSARLRSATGVVIKGGLTVGLSGANLNLSSLTWAAGDNIQVAAGPAGTHAA